jgi:hypothetical protein
MEAGGADLDNCALELVEWRAVDRKGGRSDWWMEFSELGQPGNGGKHQSKNRRLYMKHGD